MRPIVAITKEQAIHIAHKIIGHTHIDKENCLYQVQELLDMKMYEQSILHGIEWFRIFEYLKEQGIDLSVYSEEPHHRNKT